MLYCNFRLIAKGVMVLYDKVYAVIHIGVYSMEEDVKLHEFMLYYNFRLIAKGVMVLYDKVYVVIHIAVYFMDNAWLFTLVG